MSKTLQNRKISRFEKIVRLTLKHFFPNVSFKYNYRPDWLRRNGRNLELDIFSESLNLAVEVNGPLHKFDYVHNKDEFKKKCCDDRNIKLYVIRSKGDIYALATSLWKEGLINSKTLPYRIKRIIHQYSPKTLKGQGRLYYAATVQERLRLAKQKQDEETLSIKERRAKIVMNS